MTRLRWRTNRPLPLAEAIPRQRRGKIIAQYTYYPIGKLLTKSVTSL
ncbi:hypothetical protein [Azospirillum endophyticum]